jgi:amino acid transporter
MPTKGNKFGAFKGVFTPSILTILGVIMYLRLPWIVGQAGLWATLGIILVAHLISASTGLSVASIATDKKVETGGTYYMISRSLGLPIGGTLGLALFVGLSFSVSLYLIGFAETLLTAFGIEATLNAIRITGAATLLLVTIITFISTNLALKMQFVILAVLLLSLVSIVLGKHDMVPQTALVGTATNSLPWIALFAIFFPAVTGFEAGVSMSGDLENPKKSIPFGTISAIVVGLVVYIGLVFFFSYTVDRNTLINDPGVLMNISFFSPLVVAGIWGATLSSAFGSILGAPRILQATAMDRITPKLFAKGVGAGNEPRNALLLTFVIALSGILIGDLNVIARVVSMFFIITYGFLNLTCAIENWAGADFRPSFRIPGWISIIGAIACFVVMIQLDFIAMIGATIILGAIFLFFKRKELRLQSGDTWGGIWSSLVKYGLFKLSSSTARNQRNWRPNVILFSGGAKARPHLVDMGRTIVGKQGVFTNFELVEKPEEDYLFDRTATATIETDHRGRNIITRRHVCGNKYEGMQMISRVYGFTGFEPNTILMGWAKNSANPERFCETASVLHKLNYNLVFYNFKNQQNKAPAQAKRVDLWWNGNSRNLNFGLALLKFITTDSEWRGTMVRLLIVNYNTTKTDSVYALANQALDNSRLMGSVKVINNSVEKLPEVDIIKRESADASLAILEMNQDMHKESSAWVSYVNGAIDLPCSSLVIEASQNFEVVNAHTVPEVSTTDQGQAAHNQAFNLSDIVRYPEKELLANELRKLAEQYGHQQNVFVDNSVNEIQGLISQFHDDVESNCSKILSSLRKAIEQEKGLDPWAFSKILSDYTFQAKSRIAELIADDLTKGQGILADALAVYMQKSASLLVKIPERMVVSFSRPEFKIRRTDSLRIRITKAACKLRGAFLGWPISRRVDLAKSAELFLHENRLEDFNEFFTQLGLISFRYFSNIRRVLTDLPHKLEQLQHGNEDISKELDSLLADEEDNLSSALSDFKKSTEQITADLNSSLVQSLQRMIFVIEKPESTHLLRSYAKLINKRPHTTDTLGQAPQVWMDNLTLYSNKIHVEFMLMSLRYRLGVKISRQVEELNIWTKNNILKSIASAKELLNQYLSSNDLPNPSDLTQRIDEINTPHMQERFEVLFRDVNAIIEGMPELVDVNSDNFFSDLEQGKFMAGDVRSIDFKRRVQLYVGMELISKARTSMEGVSDSLRVTAKTLRDKLRLAAFNIENMLAQNEAKTNSSSSESQQEQRATLVGELLGEIELEEKRLKDLLAKFDVDLQQYLVSAMEPLHQLVHSKVDDKIRKRKKKSQASFRWFTSSVQKISKFVNRQVVGVLYSQSEGLLLAQKLTNFEKEYKLSNQSVQEMLVSLAGDAEVLKKVPFYYANLFSGSTTLNEDLWIERPAEQRIAQQVVSRYNAGYSGALLITGDRNSGKTTLSKYIAKKYFPKHRVISVKAPLGGSSSISELMLGLQKALGTQANPEFYLANNPEPRVIIINDLDLWWERHNQGLDVIRKIYALIENLSRNNFFIVNCGTFAYQLINRVEKFDSVFMGSIECQPFDAKDLKDLITARHKTGGLSLVYKGKQERELTEWNYARLFNKYFNISEGNPGYALQLWLTSITKVVGKTIHIRKPEVPNLSYLRGISDELLVVILQIIIHRRCSLARLARVLRQSDEQTLVLIKNLHRSGIIEERFVGVWAVNHLLEPFIVTVLQEKGLC